MKYLTAMTVLALFMGCTTASLNNGTSTATYKGAKIFSPTVLSLRSGNCAVPSVDGSGVVAEPIAATQGTSCTTSVMTVNGVDLKGLLNVLLTGIVSGIAAG